VDLETAAEELYGVPAEEFAEHRTRLAAQAKAAGDKALATGIGKLRKPVLAAALVNELVRTEPAELQQLGELGEQLRSAHRELRGPELRALSEQRQQLLQRLTDLVRETAEQGGRTVTEPVLAQVRGTFDAAIADEGAAAAVLSGRLTTVLSYTGFGEVDVTDAVATPVRKRHLKSVPAGTAVPKTAVPKTAAPHEAPADGPDAAPRGKRSEPAASKRAGAATAGRNAADRPSSSAEQAHERRQQRHLEQFRGAEDEHAEATRALEWAREEADNAERLLREATARVEQLRAELSQAQELSWRAGQANRAAERTRHAAEQEAERTATALQAVRDQLDEPNPD
jgi:hypothetical protein